MLVLLDRSVILSNKINANCIYYAEQMKAVFILCS